MQKHLNKSQRYEKTDTKYEQETDLEKTRRPLPIWCREIMRALRRMCFKKFNSISFYHISG